MDAGAIFIGIICFVIAWALWTYLPHPLGIIGGLIFGLLGIYFLYLGVAAGTLDQHHGHAAATVLRSSWG